MDADFVIGRRILGATGLKTQASISKDGSVIVQQSHGRWQEAALGGGLFSLSTAAAGVTIAAANVFSAANPQPLVGLYNPTTSGKNCVIARATHSWNSGTPGTGGLVWAIQLAPPTALTSAGAVNSAVNGFTGLGDGLMRQFVNVALTGAVLLFYRHSGGPSAIAIAAGALTFIDLVEGEIILPPGACGGLFAAAAGTSPIVNASMSYELVPT